jgi:hypothetical protein
VTPHLVIPYAACQSPESTVALAALQLPRLRELVARLSVQSWLRGDATTPQLPHERLLVQLAGASDGLRRDQARITPTHWAIQSNRIDLIDPQGLALSEAESRTLCESMQPYFAEDGIALHFESPLCWLAVSPALQDIDFASIDRALGRNLLDWLPTSAASKPLRRLQQEMQMLLYTHPVNAVRAAQGLLTVNSFWIGPWIPTGVDALLPPAVQVCDDLRRPALAEDWQAWAQAWSRIDTNAFAPLCHALDRGDLVQLSLCGEGSSVSLSCARDGQYTSSPWARLADWARMRTQPLAALHLLSQL